MKLCSCGGMMVRKDITWLKRTKETKIRLLCKECRKLESHYYDGVPAIKSLRTPSGRPGYADGAL